MTARPTDRLGVLLIGAGGATASTVAAGAVLMAHGMRPVEYGVTSRAPFDSLRLPAVDSMRWGGWDLQPGTLTDAVLRNKVLSVSPRESAVLEGVTFDAGVRTSLDIPVEPKHAVTNTDQQLASITSELVRNIHTFRTRNGCDQIVVVYLGSPPREPAGQSLRNCTYTELLDLDSLTLSAKLPSCVIYALAACEAGADFIDFTPSPTLEYEAVLEVARESKVQLAGRDGSTGQTMLKSWLAELFIGRALNIDSWYSTNLIGNHDGYVLSLPGHDELKIRDKTDGLRALHADIQPDHKVSIEYMPSWGDDKESWDAIRLMGWMGSRAELRINWRGQDSYLAAPLLLDLTRLISYGRTLGLSGFQPHLGYFFKRPLRREGVPLSELRRELVAFYDPE